MQLTNAIIDLTVLGLATWKLSSMLVIEQGPASIFEKFRESVGLKFTEGQVIPENWFAKDLTCQYCAMIYPALVLTVLYVLLPKVTIYLSLPFALSTIGTLIMTSKGIQVFMRHLKDG